MDPNTIKRLEKWNLKSIYALICKSDDDEIIKISREDNLEKLT